MEIDNSLKIMEALGHMETSLTRELGELKATCATIAAHNAAVSDRVKVIEDDKKWSDIKHWTIAPGMILIKGILGHKFPGLKF